jgi:CHAT domain-containing protein/Tfp pilus assembly protein PilF
MIVFARRASLALVLALICILGLSPTIAVAPAQPVPQDDDLTPAQHQKLETEAFRLNQQGFNSFQQGKGSFEQGKWEAALKLCTQALELRRRLYPEKRYPDGHPDLALSLNNVGYLLQSRGEVAKAEPYFRQALAMREKLYPVARYPKGHSNLALSLSHLGFLLQTRGELIQAEPFLRRALVMYQTLYPAADYPEGHPILASSQSNLGDLLRERGELDKAEPYYRQALAMRQRLFPPSRYPDGHASLALSLNNLGALLRDGGELSRAEPCYRQALAMYQKLYPADRFPAGHPNLATSLGNLGRLLQDRGELAKAEPYFRDALAMRQKLYPAVRFPDGHPQLAGSLRALGGLLRARGELVRAESYFRQALAMDQKLYPVARFPDGHPDLATSLTSLGSFLQARGELAQAEQCLRQALGMREKLYPAARFPSGHPALTRSLIHLGALLRAQGELDAAEQCYRRALAMAEKLFPRKHYPDGHPDLAASLNYLGAVFVDLGESARAEAYFRQALFMCQKLYAADRYPDGHPNLANSLGNLGGLLEDRNEPARAEPYLCQSLAMNQRLLNGLLAGSAEVEALNFLAQLPWAADAYLSVTARLCDKTDAAYAALWHAKGAVAHMLQLRRRSLELAADPVSRDLAAQLANARQDLANLLRPGVSPQPGRVRKLSDQKEKLEKQLADKLPLYKALKERLQRGPADLVALLPAGVVFCDLARYRRLSHDPEIPGEKGERWTLCYLAFVSARGQPVRRLELGEAGPIDRALAAWRRSLQAGQAASPAADALRRLLWRPLEKSFPAGTRIVILAPDAALTGLPWATLPGSQPGRWLLEEYALTTVPDGQLLLHLLSSPRESKNTGVLAAGGIDYDHAAAAVALAPQAEGLARAPQPGKEHPLWAALPATTQELAQVERLAGARPLVKRAGAAAGTRQLLADLPQARWAHLATHGFFADPSVRSVLQLSPQDYKRSQRGERIGTGSRNPLVLSGLVCAGANRPVTDPEKEDGGILTAEAIAGLNLDGLELAVLSACETGLGESGGGEGVFGLQRAFHIAGARSVVATLWKIDDAATQALMAEFYRNLWERKLPRLEAVRRAQLAMLLHYDTKTGRLRAPGAAVPVDPAELAAARQKLRSAGRPPLPPLYWAGFVLSGDWR